MISNLFIFYLFININVYYYLANIEFVLIVKTLLRVFVLLQRQRKQQQKTEKKILY